MTIKVIKKSSESLNTLIFVLLSLPFIHIVRSLHMGESALDWTSLKGFLFANPWKVGLVSFLLLLIYKARKVSSLFVPVLVIAFFSWAIIFFIEDWNKHILFLSFIYLVIGFYTCLFWRAELERPIYRPGFKENYIGKKSEYELSGTLVDKNGSKIKFYLSNWGECSCFLVPLETKSKLKGKVKLMLHLGKHEFVASGTIVSLNSSGYGISLDLTEQKTQSLGWNDYYAIISDRGYFSRFV